jgi:dTDP-4-dehydrorhamnose 3,5-epimerase
MRFTETGVSGAYLIDPDPHGDDRGFFARLWCREEFGAKGLRPMIAQCNNAFTARRGTLRGLHYQVAPYEEVKIVRCVRGAIFDVYVDLRPDSATYLRWFGAELTAENRRLMYVPEGCAHGYLTLADDTELIYFVSQSYHPEAERGVRWNDPRFGIKWPAVESLTISAKDEQWADYARRDPAASPL